MASGDAERWLPDERATARLGEDIAMALRPGDVIALAGDLGAGKTTLARGLIRALAGDPGLEVPSPTFTLVQPYAGPPPLFHFDLYRLGDAAELEELGFDDAVREGVALVEWPERAGSRLPNDTVTIDLSHHGAGRTARFHGVGPAFDRITRSLAMRDFLESSGWGDARRRRLAGDASARSYETVEQDGAEPRLLMNAPPLVLGPPVRDGRAYAEIAHTARNVAAFVAVDRVLAANGVTVPEIHAADLARGFLLIEHLGTGSFLGEAGEPVAERYAAAAQLLAMMHARPWPDRVEAAPGAIHTVPPFDRDAMLIEADLLVDWYVPFATGRPADEELRGAYRYAWNAVLDGISGAEQSLVLRDFHSPNIIWRGDREGHDRLGVIDFQDALIGPAAYDVASLSMDARVTVPEPVTQTVLDAYGAARRAGGPFDADAFRHAHAVMAAQRNSKILGIFVRLDRRDGKPEYLKHLPRIRDYLRRAFRHPALAGLAAFYRDNGLLEEG